MNSVRTLFAAVLTGACVLMAPGAGAQEADSEAQAVVRDTTERVLALLRQERETFKTDPGRLYALVNDLILPRFDFERMSRWVLGRYWRQASEAQRTAFVKEFESLLVRTYSGALGEYRDQKVVFEATRARAADEATVRASIEQGAGPAIPISYEMYRTGEGWKVYDVAVNGVSLVINYRSSFSKEIGRSGIDGLIQRLGEKNRTANG